MNISPVGVAVIDKKTITKAEVLRTDKDGKTINIKAIANGKYMLTQTQDGVAPENLTVKRVGKNLLVMLEGADASKPDLVIEDFFAKSGALVGKAEDGEIHPFVATDGNSEHEAAALADGETSALALGEETVSDNDASSGWLLAEGFDWSPALMALGGLAAIGLAAGLGYTAAKHHYQGENRAGNGAGDRDDNGNGSGGSDGEVPAAPEIKEVIDDVGSVTGPIKNGGRTDDATPTLNGTGNPGNTISIYDGKTLLGTVKVDDKGNWSFTPSKALSAGEHKLTTVETDSAGKSSEASEPFTVIIDLTAPSKGTINAIVDDSETPPKSIANEGATKDVTPTLSGKAEAGSTVEIWSDGKFLGTAKTDSEGNWSFTTPELAEGKHELSVVVIDEVGNKSLPSQPYIIEVDVTPPVNKGIGGITDDEGNPLKNGSETNDTTPTFSGEGDDGDTVLIIDNGKIIGSAVVEEGKWSFTPDKPLSGGDHDFSVIVRDPAGNESESSDKTQVTIIAPVTPVDPIEEPLPQPDPTIPVTGTIEHVYKDNNPGGYKQPVENGGAVNDPTLLFEGKGIAGQIAVLYVHDGDKVTAYSTTIDADGKWNINLPELKDGNYTFEAAFYDGDKMTATTPKWELEVDTIPPPPPEIDSLALANLTGLLAEGTEDLFAADDISPEQASVTLDLAALADMAVIQTQNGIENCTNNDSISDIQTMLAYEYQVL